MFKSMTVEFHTCDAKVNGKTGETFVTAIGNITSVNGNEQDSLVGKGFQHSTSDVAEMEWLEGNARKFPVFEYTEVELGEPFHGESNDWYKADAFKGAKLITQRRGALSF